MNIDGKEIKISYSTIKINTQSAQFINNNMTDTYGQYLYRENKIEIQPNLNKVDEANTLIHEILHAGVWISSLNQVGQPLELDTNEELVINNLANILTQVLIDNKWLLPYLTSKLE